MSLRTLAAAVLATAAALSPARAQVRADPGTVINGRVAVRVTVTLSDEETTYAPIGGVNLRFFRTTAETTVVVRTDESGTATALLSPGEYRLISTSPVDWKGSRYSWSRMVDVRAGLATIELTAASAERSAVVLDPTAPPPPAPRKADDDDDESIVRKDPSAATMYAFFLPGTGQLYAGERAKGTTLVGLAVVGAALAGKQLSCAAASDCKSTTGGMTLGAAGMVAFFGSWIYGIMDAGDAARRYNAAHGFASAGITPTVGPDGYGGARVGLVLAFGR